MNSPQNPPQDNQVTIPSIKPAQDEVASFRKSDRSEVQKQSNFNALLVFVIVLMVIVMGIGGYALYEVQKKLDRSNLLLNQSQEKIKQLDARFAVTGTDVSKTLQDLNSLVSKNFSEIDKLWTIAHRQNKPDIQKNVRALDALEKNLEEQLNTVNNSIKFLSGRYETLLAEMTELKENGQNEELITGIALLRGKIQDQEVVQEAFNRNLNLLTRQMKQTQEAIEAIDQHRLQINQRLLRLENR